MVQQLLNSHSNFSVNEIIIKGLVKKRDISYESKVIAVQKILIITKPEYWLLIIFVDKVFIINYNSIAKIIFKR